VSHWKFDATRRLQELRAPSPIALTSENHITVIKLLLPSCNSRHTYCRANANSVVRGSTGGTVQSSAKMAVSLSAAYTSSLREFAECATSNNEPEAKLPRFGERGEMDWQTPPHTFRRDLRNLAPIPFFNQWKRKPCRGRVTTRSFEVWSGCNRNKTLSQTLGTDTLHIWTLARQLHNKGLDQASSSSSSHAEASQLAWCTGGTGGSGGPPSAA